MSKQIKICPKCGRQMTDEVFEGWWFCDPCFIRITKKFENLTNMDWEPEFDRLTLYAKIQVREQWAEWFDRYNDKIKEFIKALLLNQEMNRRK